jgi:transcriptional antiterminator Rof (Rho-off)
VVRVQNKTKLRFRTIALATLQAAVMNGAQDETCFVEGAEYLAELASADQICRKFKQSLFKALDDAVDQHTFTVTLSIKEGGTITAVLISKESEKTERYLEVAVDVMDRALNLSDLDRLAKAAADIMSKQ